MNSMTGFGRGTACVDGREATVEVKAVNSRYLDLSFRIPRSLGALEERMRQSITAVLGRGKVDVYVNYKNRREDHAEVLVDEALARSYRQALQTLSEATGLIDAVSLTTLAGYPQVLTLQETEEDEEAVWQVLSQALSQALLTLCSMRQKEGERLKEDLLQKAGHVRAYVESIQQAAPGIEQAAKDRLMQKMQEYVEADETLRQRILTEAAILADKPAIDEELVRLHSHLYQFEQTLLQQEAAGRKLDFIVQEMNREINTIGSKANDKEIAQSVIAVKSELEKMREQVQNIE